MSRHSHNWSVLEYEKAGTLVIPPIVGFNMEIICRPKRYEYPERVVWACICGKRRLFVNGKEVK